MHTVPGRRERCTQYPDRHFRLKMDADDPTDDGVTPETCLDFDAQHIDTYQGLLQWMGGLGFFVSLGAFMKYVWKPDTLRAPAPREFPYNGLVVELGGNAPADADGDDEE